MSKNPPKNWLKNAYLKFWTKVVIFYLLLELRTVFDVDIYIILTLEKIPIFS